MPRREVLLPSANSVGAGQTGVLDLPTDRRYHATFIEYSNSGGTPTRKQIEEDIDEIRLKIDGRVQRIMSPEQLFKLLAFNGILYNNDGLIPLYFSEPWRASVLDEDVLSWGMANVGTFQIEIDFNPSASGPTISGYAEIDNASEPLTGIIKWYRQNVPVTTTGITTLSTLSKSLGAYLRLHAFEDGEGDISDVDIQVDQVTVFDIDRDRMRRQLRRIGRFFSPQDSMFHIVFDSTQRVSDDLPMVKQNGNQVSEFRIDWNMAVAKTFTLLSEVTGDPD